MVTSRQVIPGTPPTQTILVQADYSCAVTDQCIDVQIAGVRVTLPPNPVAGETVIEFAAEQPFNLSGGLNPFSSDPQGIPASAQFFAVYTKIGWLLTAFTVGNVLPPLTTQAIYISTAGIDTNPGTLAAPVRTFQGGVLAKWKTSTPLVSPGATVQVIYLNTPSAADVVSVDPTIPATSLVAFSGIPTVLAATTVTSFVVAAPGPAGQSTQWQVGTAADLTPFLGKMVLDSTANVWFHLDGFDAVTGLFTMSAAFSPYAPGSANLYPAMSGSGAAIIQAGDALTVYDFPVVPFAHLSNKSGQAPRGLSIQHLVVGAGGPSFDVDGSITISESLVAIALAGQADLSLVNCALAPSASSSVHSIRVVGGRIVGGVGTPQAIALEAGGEVTGTAIVGASSTQVLFSGTGPLLFNGVFIENVLYVDGLVSRIDLDTPSHGYLYPNQIWGMNLEFEDGANFALKNGSTFVASVDVASLMLDTLSVATALDLSQSPSPWNSGLTLSPANLDTAIAASGFNYAASGPTECYALGAGASVLWAVQAPS
jgi:hypothetical protein